MPTFAEQVVAHAHGADLPDFLPTAIREADRVRIDNVAAYVHSGRWLPDARDLPNLAPASALGWYEYRPDPALLIEMRTPPRSTVGFLFSSAPYQDNWLTITHCLSADRGGRARLDGTIEMEVDRDGHFRHWWLDAHHGDEDTLRLLTYPALLAITFRHSPRVSLEQSRGDGRRVRRRQRDGQLGLSCRELWIKPVVRVLDRAMSSGRGMAAALYETRAEFGGRPRALRGPLDVLDLSEQTAPRLPSSPALFRSLATRVGGTPIASF